MSKIFCFVSRLFLSLACFATNASRIFVATFVATHLSVYVESVYSVLYDSVRRSLP